MKVLILADSNSAHTIRWVKALTNQGVEVGLWSLAPPKEGVYDDCQNVVIANAGIVQKRSGIVSKLRYLSSVGSLKRFLKSFEPDILHAHYASSYGLLGRLVNFHPYIISVWGTDIYEFPQKGTVFKKIIKDNLKTADCILSTSGAMASETRKYTDKQVHITPFGIDLEEFFNCRAVEDQNIPRPFTFGTIKSLERQYGVNYLIEAFALFRENLKQANVLLYIVGSGSQELELKALAKQKNLDGVCIFEGSVPHDKVPLYHNKLDVAVFLSNNESFGVAVVEASATETPVIVSDVGGLPEVVVDGETGIVVPIANVIKAAEAMERLFLDSTLRKKMGRQGRERVEKLYNWNENVGQMINIYKHLLSK